MSIDDPLLIRVANVRPHFAVRHEGNRVTMSFDVTDEYAAMMFVDKFEHEVRRPGDLTVVWQFVNGEAKR